MSNLPQDDRIDRPVLVSGSAVRGLLRYVKEAGIPGGISALIRDLPAESAAHLKSQVLTTSWYPYPVFLDLLAVVRERLGGDVRRLREVGRDSARRDVHTVFKLVARLASVERLMVRSRVFWSRYCDAGEWRARVTGPGRAEIRLEDFPQMAPDHCELTAGWIEGIGLAIGLEQPRVTATACVNRGDDHCGFEARWGDRATRGNRSGAEG